MVVVVVGFCFSREASVWFSAVLKCFNFHIFLKILGFFFLLLCNSHTIRRGMGVETRAQKPSHKVLQKFPERSWLANAVKILVIMMWDRLQTTKCITKFSDLLLSGFCVSCFLFLYLLVRLSFFTDASFFLVLFCISIMTLLFVFFLAVSSFFYDDILSFWWFLSQYHPMESAREYGSCLCNESFVVVEVWTQRILVCIHVLVLRWFLWKKVCWLTFLFYCNICVVCYGPREK